jgi:hypothetical protein
VPYLRPQQVKVLVHCGDGWVQCPFVITSSSSRRIRRHCKHNQHTLLLAPLLPLLLHKWLLPWLLLLLLCRH